MKEGKGIDFIGIGVQKSGTTWLYNLLRQIPEFDLPPRKEFHYFDSSSQYPSPSTLQKTSVRERLSLGYIKYAFETIGKQVKKKDWKAMKFYQNWFFSNYSDDWYASMFDMFEGFTGEITPSYSMLEVDDIARIFKIAPKVKLILLLRNPIDRAWSHYRFSKGKEQMGNDDYIIKFMDSDKQEKRSNYLRTIENYTNIFPKEQLLIGFYDAIQEQPEILIQQILGFICDSELLSTENLEANQVIHKSPELEIPKSIYQFLKDKYQDQIAQLANDHGGYFSRWYQDNYTDKTSTQKYPPTMIIK